MGFRMVGQIENWMNGPELVVVYDGLCPFCSAYIQMLRLKQSVRTVELIDARSRPEIVEEFAARGLDLDNGMSVIYGSRLYYGSDAVNVLSHLTTASGLVNRGVAFVLRNPATARTIYPVMRHGRALALTLLRRPSLN